jgi:hypothetical protein
MTEHEYKIWREGYRAGYHRAYYTANKDKLLAYGKEWYKENREAHIAYVKMKREEKKYDLHTKGNQGNRESGINPETSQESQTETTD